MRHRLLLLVVVLMLVVLARPALADIPPIPDPGDEAAVEPQPNEQPTEQPAEEGGGTWVWPALGGVVVLAGAGALLLRRGRQGDA